jgi:hypothetical protein
MQSLDTRVDQTCRFIFFLCDLGLKLVVSSDTILSEKLEGRNSIYLSKSSYLLTLHRHRVIHSQGIAYIQHHHFIPFTKLLTQAYHDS